LSAEPNEQILVRNVSGAEDVTQLADAQLPWSTSNEDLVELFETVGNVALAEILFEGEQSKAKVLCSSQRRPRRSKRGTDSWVISTAVSLVGDAAVHH
jgi:hypothetical protein